jgi:uridylate kinase
VLLKLSGEVFGGKKGIGVDPDVLADVAKQIAAVVREGTQIAIVVGGGNLGCWSIIFSESSELLGYVGLL